MQKKTMGHAGVLVFGAGLALILASACLAAEQMLNIEPGLWEVTSVGATTGRPPIPAETLARMAPAQRAQVEASIKDAMEAASRPDVCDRASPRRRWSAGWI